MSTNDVVRDIDEALAWEENWEANAMRSHPDLPETDDGDLLPGELDPRMVLAGLANMGVTAARAVAGAREMQAALERVRVVFDERMSERLTEVRASFETDEQWRQDLSSARAQAAYRAALAPALHLREPCSMLPIIAT